MARDMQRQYRYGGGRVDGDLAYQLGYEEKYRRTSREHEEVRREGERRTKTAAKPQTARRVREKQKVSPVLFAGFVALAAMVVVLIMSYAQLTTLSANVVSLQSDLSALQEEHVKLLASYEKTFDLATVKEAAEASGMTKPSASQIYYVDLSAPDNVVVYQQAESNVLSRLMTSFGHAADSVVEYFR